MSSCKQLRSFGPRLPDEPANSHQSLLFYWTVATKGLILEICAISWTQQGFIVRNCVLIFSLREPRGKSKRWSSVPLPLFITAYSMARYAVLLIPMMDRNPNGGVSLTSVERSQIIDVGVTRMRLLVLRLNAVFVGIFNVCIH